MSDDSIFYCINMERLTKAPNASLVLRLMLIFNDINVVPYLSSLVKKDLTGNPAHSRLHVALGWYFLRQRSSTIAEAIRRTISYIRAQEKNNHLEGVWSVINDHQDVRSYYDRLVAYLPTWKSVYPEGELYPELKKNLEIRDSITAHHDSDDKHLLKALKTLVEASKEANEPPRSWFIVAPGDSNYTRIILADDVAATVWFNSQGIHLSSTGYDNDADVKKAGEHLEELITCSVSFIAGFLTAYLAEYDLIDENIVPPWIKSNAGPAS